MAIQGRWQLLGAAMLMSGFVLGGVFVYALSGAHRTGGSPMNDSRFTVDHVSLRTRTPFEVVTTAFERESGEFDPVVYKSLAESGDAEAVRARIEAMGGPSGIMLFAKHNHGELLRIAGQNRRAIQYQVGNPLIALQMTQHDIPSGSRVKVEGQETQRHPMPSSAFIVCKWKGGPACFPHCSPYHGTELVQNSGPERRVHASNLAYCAIQKGSFP